MHTVVALFKNFGDADRGIKTLVGRGFDRDTISVAAHESAMAHAVGNGHDGAVDTEHETADGAGKGAMVGGLSGLLVGIGALMIPGVGPLFVTGVLASLVTSTLAGITAGGVAGGLAGALSEYGLPNDTAQTYAEGLKQGGVVLSIRTDRTQDAVSLLQSCGASDVHELTLAGKVTMPA